MSEGELVEVMDMGDSKVEGCQENSLRRRDSGNKMEGHQERAKGQLFGDRTLERS